MIPINVTVQYLREGSKTSARIRLSMDATVRQAIQQLIAELGLPTEEDGQPLMFHLLLNRQMLISDDRLFEVGIQEGSIIQLVASDPHATTAGIPSNVLSRMGGKSGSNAPLTVAASLVAKEGGQVFPLRRVRALIGRADTTLGYPPDSLDADLTALDPSRNVSRPHALIVYLDGQFTVRDLYSQHGVLLNGQAVGANAPEPIQDGDWLSFGGVELQFRVGS